MSRLLQIFFLPAVDFFKDGNPGRSDIDSSDDGQGARGVSSCWLITAMRCLLSVTNPKAELPILTSWSWGRAGPDEKDVVPSSDMEEKGA